MTKGVINAEIRQNDWNIDRSFIFIIPLILVAVLIWMPEEWLLESSLLCIAVFVYILLTYNLCIKFYPKYSINENSLCD